MAERLFWSLHPELLIKTDDEREKKLISAKIEGWNSNISYLLHSMRISRNSNNKYCLSFYKFLEDEVNRRTKNYHGLQIAVYYTGPKINKEVILNFPVEVLEIMDSTLWKLKV